MDGENLFYSAVGMARDSSSFGLDEEWRQPLTDTHAMTLAQERQMCDLEGTSNPIERIMLSASGNLQQLLAAYFNDEICIQVHRHQCTPEAVLLRPWILENLDHSFLTLVPQRILNRHCYIVSRLITLRQASDPTRILTIDKSLCFQGVELSDAVEVDQLFRSGSLGIGQYFQARCSRPAYQLLSCCRGKCPSFSDAQCWDTFGPVSLSRTLALHDESFFCLIKEAFVHAFS